MRGKPAPKRDIKPDPRYNDVEIAKFMNYLMQRGKKTIARKVLYDCFDIIKDRTKQDPRHIFNRAIKQVSPIVEVRGKRVGGANYQVPFQVRTERRFTLASRWILNAANAKTGKKMAEKLADELIDAAKGEGSAIKKKQDVYKMAEANKAFAYFAR